MNSLLDPCPPPYDKHLHCDTRTFIHTHTHNNTSNTQEHKRHAALRRAAGAPQPAIRPARVRVVDGVDETKPQRQLAAQQEPQMGPGQAWQA